MAQSTKTKFASLNTAITTGWTSPTNAYADDISYATAVPAKNTTIDSDYGFADFTSADIPDNAVIVSVTMSALVVNSATTTNKTHGVYGRVSGANSGSEGTNTGNTVEATITGTLGTVTLANLRSASTVLKARVRSTQGNSSTTSTSSLDWVNITVTYNPQSFAQAQAQVATFSPRAYAQARTKIIAFGVTRYSQAQTSIKAFTGTDVKIPFTSNSGSIISQSGTYSIAQSGNNLLITSPQQIIGQASLYAIYELFLEAVTSVIPNSSVITSLSVYLYGLSDGTTTADFQITLALYDYGSSLTTADWRTLAQIQALDGQIGLNTSDIITWNEAEWVFSNSSEWARALPVGVPLRFIAWSSRHENSTPTSNELLETYVPNVDSYLLISWNPPQGYAQAQAKIKIQDTRYAQAQVQIASSGTPDYVQSLGTANTTSSVTQLAISTTKTITAGNTIVVSVSKYTSSTVTVVDNLGNTYTQQSYKYTSPTQVSVFVAPVTTGGTLTSITASWTGATTDISVIADEFSGLGTPSAGGTANGNSVTGTWFPSGTIPANYMVVGALFSQNPRTHTVGAASGTPSTPMTLRTSLGDGAYDPSLSHSSAVAGASDVTTFVGTTGLGLSTAWVGASVLFAAAAGGAVGYYGQAQARIKKVTFYSKTVEGDSPVSYWRLDELSGSYAYDMITTNTGTYTGTTNGVSGALFDGDLAAEFGSGDYVSVTHQSGLNPITNFTLEIWAKLTSGQTGYKTLFGKGTSDGDWVLFVDASTNYITFDSNTGSAHEAESTAITTDAWHHIVTTYGAGAGTGKIYVDGIDVTVPKAGTTFTANTSPLQIGAENSVANWIGQLDEPALYSSVLSATKVWDHYTIGKIGSLIRPAQAQATISIVSAVTYRGYAQTQAHIKFLADKEYGQAQAQIKNTYQSYAQAQSIIKVVDREFAQAQSQIKVIANKSYAQAQVWIEQSYQGYAQTATWIEQTYKGYAQAQGQIKATYQVWAQGQAHIKQSYQGYAQGQVQIKTVYRVYAQALTNIKTSYLSYAQVLASVKASSLVYAQAHTWIKQTYPLITVVDTTVAQDSFTDTDATVLTSHTPEIGGSWSLWKTPGGNLSIYSNELWAVRAGTSGRYHYRLGTTTLGDADHLNTGLYTGDDYSGGTWFRGIDSDNFYYIVEDRGLTTHYLYRLTANASTSLGSWTLGNVVDARIRVRVAGSSPTSIKVRDWLLSDGEPDTWKLEVSDNTAGNQTAAGAFGIEGSASTSISWVGDDYLVTTLGSGVQGPTYAQAQTTIIAAITYKIYAQSQGQIKATYQVRAQGQSHIKVTNNKSYAQSLAQIKQTYLVYAQSQAQIKTTYRGYAQAQSQIKATYQAYAQGQTKIILSGKQAYAQVQAQIKQTYQGYAQGQAKIILSGRQSYGQSQAQVKQAYMVYAQAQVTLKVTTLVYAQANANIIQTYQAYGQAQAKLRAFNIQQYGQSNAWVKDTGLLAYAQSLAQIKASYQTVAQAQAQIEQTYKVYAQSLVQIKATYLVHAQANTYIKTTGLQVVAQGQAQIKQTYIGCAQANAYIRLSGLQVYGQAQAIIKTTYQVYGQAQAKLNAFNIQTYAQAMAAVEGSFTQFAQSQAKLNAFAVKSYGQAQVWIKTTYVAYAQSQARIKTAYLPCAQAQANIKATSTVYAQVQAQIKTTYQAYAQAQSKIILSALQVYGQAQTQIKTSYVVYAQANARIITVGLSVYAQALAQIKQTYRGYAQANTYVKVTGNVTFAQAQAQIKTTYKVYAQAQGWIKSSYYGYAQAQSYIIVRDIKAYAQAGATIKSSGYAYAQAEVWIYMPQIARPISDISNDGNWVGTIKN